MFLLPSCMHLPSLPAAAREHLELLLKKSSFSCKNVPGAAASLPSNSRTDASCGWMPTAEIRVAHHLLPLHPFTSRSQQPGNPMRTLLLVSNTRVLAHSIGIHLVPQIAVRRQLASDHSARLRETQAAAKRRQRSQVCRLERQGHGLQIGELTITIHRLGYGGHSA